MLSALRDAKESSNLRVVDIVEEIGALRHNVPKNFLQIDVNKWCKPTRLQHTERKSFVRRPPARFAV